MLQKWLQDNQMNKRRFSAITGIARPTLDRILGDNTKNIYFKTAMKIYRFTGLMPWEYLNGYETEKDDYHYTTQNSTINDKVEVVQKV